MGKIVICGDSFSIGIGVKDLLVDSWGPIIANNYKRELINFAKGSSTNYSISLQSDYAIENIKDIDLLIISDTCEHRINFFKEKEHLNRSRNPWGYRQINNLDVNYHEYPPYGPGTYHQIIPHPYSNNPEYRGNLNTENWHGIIDYTDRILKDKDTLGEYYSQFNGDNQRLLLLREYYLKIQDIQIQRKQDVGCLLLSYFRAKRANVPVLLAMDKQEIQEIVPKEDYVKISWGKLALNYPDTIGSLHTSEKGQKEAAMTTIRHIDDYKKLKH